MKTIVSEKGQITIPKAVRNRLGFKTGTVLQIDMEKGRMIARKQTETDALHKWRGTGRLPGNGNVDAYLKRVRG
jgi:AbrB family looped-hinge helix DNA binding protein